MTTAAIANTLESPGARAFAANGVCHIEMYTHRDYLVRFAPPQTA
jgi:hypothetical protein